MPSGARQISKAGIVLLCLVDLEDQPGGREHVGRQVRRVGVAHDHRREGVVLHLAEKMQPVEPLQIVEAVAALQLLHLPSKTKLKVEPSMPPKGMICFGKTADPEVDVFEAAESHWLDA